MTEVAAVNVVEAEVPLTIDELGDLRRLDAVSAVALQNLAVRAVREIVRLRGRSGRARAQLEELRVDLGVDEEQHPLAPVIARIIDALDGEP